MDSPPAYFQPAAPPSDKRSTPEPNSTFAPGNSSSARNYDDIHYLKPDGPPLPFPDKLASASQVRAYIHNFFLRNAVARDIEPAEVERLSRIWRHGTGEELREYELATFQKLYGDDLGSALSKQVKKDKDPHEAVGAFLGFAAFCTIPAALCLFLRSSKTAMVFGIIFSLVVIVLVGAGIYASRQATIDTAKIKKAAEDFYGGAEGMEMPLMGPQRVEDGDEQ